MYKQLAIVFVCLVGLSQAQYLAAPGPVAAGPVLAAPVAAPAAFTTSHHVGNVQSVARSFSHVPQTRFSRTDWHQPGSLITSPVYSPIVSPVLGQIAVPGPTRYEQFLVPRAPLVENLVHHVPGVAHVPTVAHVPAALPAYAPLPVPVAAPLPVAAAAPVYAAPAPVAAAPVPAPAPIAAAPVKGY